MNESDIQSSVLNGNFMLSRMTPTTVHRHAVDLDGATDDGWVAAIAALPHRAAQEYRRRPAGAVVISHEGRPITARSPVMANMAAACTRPDTPLRRDPRRQSRRSWQH